MIEVDNLSKYYGPKKALDRISFAANDGEILGFLGPNGAGKSTTMNILTGYISGTSGRALINEIDILENPTAAKQSIGYLPEQPPLYTDMTVDEYLKFVYGLKKCRLPRTSHLNEICELVKLTDVRGRLIANLSKGYRQRVGIAQALIGNPKSLILDEPTVGLDPNQIIEIRALIKKLGKNHTLILSSHILQEIQAVCDRIVIINKGRIVANDTAENLTANLSGERKLIIQAEGQENQVRSILCKIPEISCIHTIRQSEEWVYEYEITAISGSDIRREVFRCLADGGFPLLMMKSNELSLEEVFLKITAGSTGEVFSEIQAEGIQPEQVRDNNTEDGQIQENEEAI